MQGRRAHLQSVDLGYLGGTANSIGRGFAEADILALAGSTKLIERLDRLFDWRIRVDSVLRLRLASAGEKGCGQPTW